jgi:hypothetical protein
MVQALVLSFLAGVMGGNAIPHFIKGITKETYPNMMGNGPVPNFLAGWSALIITVLLIHAVGVENFSFETFIAGAFGVLAIGLFHSWHGAFGRAS